MGALFIVLQHCTSQCGQLLTALVRPVFHRVPRLKQRIGCFSGGYTTGNTEMLTRFSAVQPQPSFLASGQ